MNKILLFSIYLLSFFSLNADDHIIYAKATSYSLFEGTYFHIGQYADKQIITDVSPENFGQQWITDEEGIMLYEFTDDADYLFYPYFFILVNYYPDFEVVTVSPWGFDGLDALINVNKQYIDFN